jgi:hypothetical protein
LRFPKRKSSRIASFCLFFHRSGSNYAGMYLAEAVWHMWITFGPLTRPLTQQFVLSPLNCFLSTQILGIPATSILTVPCVLSQRQGPVLPQNPDGHKLHDSVHKFGWRLGDLEETLSTADDCEGKGRNLCLEGAFYVLCALPSHRIPAVMMVRTSSESHRCPTQDARTMSREFVL